MNRLLPLALLLLVPAAAGQGLGTAQTAVQAPHEISLLIGENEVSFRVIGRLQCTAGFTSPDPLQVVLSSGATGPDDGEGTAWRFEQTTWNVTWEATGNGTFGIDEILIVNVDADGYGDRGYFGEISIGTVSARNASSDKCTTSGYTIPARSGHTHISVDPRPASSKGGQDAPGPLLPATVMALALLALAKRK